MVTLLYVQDILESLRVRAAWVLKCAFEILLNSLNRHAAML